MSYLQIPFLKANPSGNTTIIIPAAFPPLQYAAISAILMQDTVLAAEQVGFWEQPHNPQAAARLQMMGGEFCGNASRSFAAWLAMGGEQYLSQGGALLQPLAAPTSVLIEISGQAQPLRVDVSPNGCPFGCFAEIMMPLPLFVRHGKDALLGDYSIVAFTGIIHLVLWHKAAAINCITLARQLLLAQGLDDSCFGIMFVEQHTPYRIRPLVHVKELNSQIWEQSCGSGSVALLAALADRQQCGFERLPVSQPGGELLVSGTWDEQGLSAVRLAGELEFTAYGTAQIFLPD